MGVGQEPLRILMTSPPLSRPGGVAQYVRAVRPHFRSEVDYFSVLGMEFEKSLRSLGYRKAIFVERAPIEDEFVTDDHEPAHSSRVSGRFRILFLARMERPKGVYEALDTYRILQSKHPFV